MVYFEKTLDNDALAEEFIIAYCRAYHPAGYSTSCRKVVQPDGKVLVKVTRGSSCD